MTRLLCVLVLSSISALAQAFDVVCVKAWAEMDNKYPGLVCRGDRLMLEGRYAKALLAYEDAAKLKFFESPNFIVYLRIARAQCALKQTEACQRTLNDFESMLDIYLGRKQCQKPQEVLDSSLSKKVVEVMCDEVLLDSYTTRTKSQSHRALILEKSYRRQASVLRSQYKIPPSAGRTN